MLNTYIQVNINTCTCCKRTQLDKTIFKISFHWKFVVHEKNYLPDCVAGEDEGKSDYFQCAVHLLVDKCNWHENFLNLCIRGVLMLGLVFLDLLLRRAFLGDFFYRNLCTVITVSKQTSQIQLLFQDLVTGWYNSHQIIISNTYWVIKKLTCPVSPHNHNILFCTWPASACNCDIQVVNWVPYIGVNQTQINLKDNK